MPRIGYMNWFRTMLFLQQQLSAMAAGNGNGAASTLPSGGHNDSDMENHFKSGEYQTLIDISCALELTLMPCLPCKRTNAVTN